MNDSRAEALRSVPLFADLSAGSLERLAEAAKEIETPAGQVLVQPGTKGTGMFFIAEGTAVVETKREARELGPGDFFGELAFLHPAPRSATVTARTDVRVMILDSRAMDVIAEREPAIARRLMQAMAKRIRSNEGR